MSRFNGGYGDDESHEADHMAAPGSDADGVLSDEWWLVAPLPVDGSLGIDVSGEHDRLSPDFAKDVYNFTRIGNKAFGMKSSIAVGLLGPKLAKQCLPTGNFDDLKDASGSIHVCIRTLSAKGCPKKKGSCSYLHVGKQLALFTKTKISKHPLLMLKSCRLAGSGLRMHNQVFI